MRVERIWEEQVKVSGHLERDGSLILKFQRNTEGPWQGVMIHRDGSSLKLTHDMARELARQLLIYFPAEMKP